MAQPSPPRDPVSVVIPVHNAADRLEKVVPAWADYLARTGRGYEILLVDDGSTDATHDAAQRLAGRLHHTRVLRHEARRGFGACLRTALAEAKHPLFFYTTVDYPYTPTDLRPMLDRIEVRDQLFGRQPDLISGCRTGQPTPAVVDWCGRAWRLFWRVFAGISIEPPPTWLGFREWWYGKLVGWLFGVPLADVNSGFKLYRTAFLRRFPIQSDGDFVHAELVAKATFLTSIMDELPLTPRTDPVIPGVWRDMWRVFNSPEFRFPDGPNPGDLGEGGGPIPSEPGAPPSPVTGPHEGARSLHPSPPQPPPPPHEFPLIWAS